MYVRMQAPVALRQFRLPPFADLAHVPDLSVFFSCTASAFTLFCDPSGTSNHGCLASLSKRARSCRLLAISPRVFRVSAVPVKPC